MKTQMNLSHLKYFFDAALFSSIAEASKINFVSQSAVSQAIAKLEISLDTTLFVRSRHTFQLTAEGKIVSGLSIDDLLDYFFHNHYPPLKIQQALSAWEAVARFTELNIGVGFFPDYLTKGNRFPNVKQYPIEIPIFEYELCAFYNKGDKLSRASLAFLDIFENGRCSHVL